MAALIELENVQAAYGSRRGKSLRFVPRTYVRFVSAQCLQRFGSRTHTAGTGPALRRGRF
jgi:uncharacterized membrane protein